MKTNSQLFSCGCTLWASAAFAEPVVGVSWSNFQEERWKTDEAAIKSALEAGRRRVHFVGRSIFVSQSSYRQISKA